MYPWKLKHLKFCLTVEVLFSRISSTFFWEILIFSENEISKKNYQLNCHDDIHFAFVRFMHITPLYKMIWEGVFDFKDRKFPQFPIKTGIADKTDPKESWIGIGWSITLFLTFYPSCREISYKKWQNVLMIKICVINRSLQCFL